MRHDPGSVLTRRALGLMAPALALLLAGCAAPPLKLYTLGAPAIAASATPTTSTTVMVVSRITLPDYLDSQDIVLRRGNLIDRSSQGRWASRLSIAATDLITAELAAQRPDLLITDQPPVAPPAYRLAIAISRLDISDSGAAALEANWTIIPSNERLALIQGRASLAATGPVATDADVVSLTNQSLSLLATRIGADIRNLPAQSR